MNYLAKLRQKPKHVRNNIALSAAIVAVLPIAAYAVFALHAPRITTMADSQDQSPQFFETLTTSVREQVAAVQQAISPATSTASATPTAPAVVDRSSFDAAPIMAEQSTRTVFIATTSATTSVSGEVLGQ